MATDIAPGPAQAVRDSELVLSRNSAELWQLHHSHDENEAQQQQQQQEVVVVEGQGAVAAPTGEASAGGTAQTVDYPSNLYKEMIQRYDQNDNATFITLPEEGVRCVIC